MTVAVTARGGIATFAVKVVPGAARDRIAGALGSALKVQVSAPPEGGKANARVCEVLAEALGVAARAVSIHSGQSSPRKVVAVSGVEPAELQRRLDAIARA